MTTLKTLIVDDDPDTCRLLQTILSMEDVENTSSLNIKDNDIIALLDEEEPTLLILDYHLKDIETLPFIGDIRNNSKWKDLAVIMMSAVDLKKECVAAGANDFILKPFDWKAITDTVNGYKNGA